MLVLVSSFDTNNKTYRTYRLPLIEKNTHLCHGTIHIRAHQRTNIFLERKLKFDEEKSTENVHVRYKSTDYPLAYAGQYIYNVRVYEKKERKN